MKLSFYSVLFLFALLFSCNKNEQKPENLILETKQTPQQKHPNDAILITDNVGTKDSIKTQTVSKQKSKIELDKKIIKTATLKVEVKDFKLYNTAVHNTIKEYGGYVSQEEQSSADDKLETTITIKVPVEQFEDMVNQLPDNVIKVEEKRINTDDVSSQVVDTKSRLEAKKAMRLKYLDFLKESKNMEEVLQVQSEVNRIQEDIESATGRINLLSNQSAFSTINLVFYQVLEGYKVNVEPTFFNRLSNAFKFGFNWLADVFVLLTSVWPLWFGLILLYFGIKKVRNQRIKIINK